MKTFNQFQENAASVTIKQGSKLIPALMTGIGAAGTIYQMKRKKWDELEAPKRGRPRKLG